MDLIPSSQKETGYSASGSDSRESSGSENFMRQKFDADDERTGTEFLGVRRRFFRRFHGLHLRQRRVHTPSSRFAQFRKPAKIGSFSCSDQPGSGKKRPWKQARNRKWIKFNSSPVSSSEEVSSKSHRPPPDPPEKQNRLSKRPVRCLASGVLLLSLALLLCFFYTTLGAFLDPRQEDPVVQWFEGLDCFFQKNLNPGVLSSSEKLEASLHSSLHSKAAGEGRRRRKLAGNGNHTRSKGNLGFLIEDSTPLGVLDKARAENFARGVIIEIVGGQTILLEPEMSRGRLMDIHQFVQQMGFFGGGPNFVKAVGSQKLRRQLEVFLFNFKC